MSQQATSSGKLKILILSHSFPKNKQAPSCNFILKEIKVLAGLGLNITVVTESATEISADGVKIINTPQQRRGLYQSLKNLIDIISVLPISPIDFLYSAKKIHYIDRVEKFLIRFIKQNKIDLIHSHFAWPYGSGGSLAKAKYNIPLVITLRGIDILKEPSIGYGWRLDRFYENTLHRTLQAADRITVASNLTYKACVDFGVPKEKIMLLPNGVDIELFAPENKVDGAKSKVGLGGRPVVLSVGHFTPRKGYDYLLEAASLVIKEIPDVYFLIIGRGPLKEVTEKAIARRSLDKNMGVIESAPPLEMPFYYKACDVFCISSLVEGFGNVTIEAMACGKPVIGTKAGGTSDIVVDGVTGYLVEPKDSLNLAKKMVQLIGDSRLRSYMGREARLRVEGLYTLSRKAQGYYAIYKELCS